MCKYGFAFCLIALSLFNFNVFADKDPTQRFFSNESDIDTDVNQSLTLQGVFHREKENLAVINGKIIFLGGKIFSYTLTKITGNTVELVSEKRVLVLKLRESIR